VAISAPCRIARHCAVPPDLIMFTYFLHNHEPNGPWLLHGGLLETPQRFPDRDAAIACAVRDAGNNRCVIREEAAPRGLRIVEPQAPDENGKTAQ
jgi:hypothetical protein